MPFREPSPAPRMEGDLVKEQDAGFCRCPLRWAHLFPSLPTLLAPYHRQVQPSLTETPPWHSDTAGWDSDTEQMCLGITLITVFTHTILYSEIKSTQSSYLWKVLFPTVIETRIPAHPSGKKIKNANKNPGHLQRWRLVTKVLWNCQGDLTTWGCRAVKVWGGGSRDRKDSAGRLSPQLSPGVRGRKEEAIQIRG